MRKLNFVISAALTLSINPARKASTNPNRNKLEMMSQWKNFTLFTCSPPLNLKPSPKYLGQKSSGQPQKSPEGEDLFPVSPAPLATVLVDHIDCLVKNPIPFRLGFRQKLFL